MGATIASPTSTQLAASDAAAEPNRHFLTSLWQAVWFLSAPSDKIVGAA